MFQVLNFGHWDLFVIWCLGFGAYLWLFSPVPGDSGIGSLPLQFAQMILEIPDSHVHPVQFGLRPFSSYFPLIFSGRPICDYKTETGPSSNPAKTTRPIWRRLSLHPKEGHFPIDRIKNDLESIEKGVSQKPCIPEGMLWMSAPHSLPRLSPPEPISGSPEG